MPAAHNGAEKPVDFNQLDLLRRQRRAAIRHLWLVESEQGAAQYDFPGYSPE